MATTARTIAASAPLATSRSGARALRWAGALLVAVSWFSGACFGAYILAFFGGMAIGGTPERWNESLPRLHEAATPFATGAIGAHFLMGGILLLLGPIQLIARVRDRFPALHRWTGRVYVAAAALAGLGGLGFIVAKGTVGGAAMSIPFATYGALMAVAATLTYVHARGRRLAAHRAWAIRLYALVVGSWLYRMDYGFWFLLMGHHAGHTHDFRGSFDLAADWLFFVPNLAVAELFIRARGGAGPVLRWSAAGVMVAASLVLGLATWFAVLQFWLPNALAGAAAAAA